MPTVRMDGEAIDVEAVDALRSERLDWRFKGIPAEAFGTTVEEFLGTRPTLSGSGFVGPVLVLDEHAIEHNLRTMADWCTANGVHLAPHGKTTMAPQLFRRQLEHGAWGITAATLSQLRVYRAFGVQRILLANQLVDAAGLGWLGRELDRDPEFVFGCWVDSVRGVRLMSEALAHHGAARPVDVLIELGHDDARTGARTVAEAVEIAAAVAASPHLRLAGVAAYEGATAHGVTDQSLSVVDGYLQRVRDLVAQLAAAGHFASLAEVIVTSGGSSYFDQVAEALSAPWPTDLPVTPVLRSGAYVVHDDGVNRRMSPFGRQHRLTGDESPLRPAMRMWAQITSHPEPTLALATMGRRDVAFDQDLPEPQIVRNQDGTHRELVTGSCRVTSLADQHAFVTVEPEARLWVGDWVGFGVSHPCTMFDKWPLIPVIDGEHVVDLIRTFF